MRHIYLLDKYAFTSELCTHTRKPKHTLKLYAILVVCACVCVCVCRCVCVDVCVCNWVRGKMAVSWPFQKRMLVA